MPFIVHQNYMHHVPTEPDRKLRPWCVYPDTVLPVIPTNCPRNWLPTATVDTALVAQVEREYCGECPPIEPADLVEPAAPTPSKFAPPEEEPI